VPDITSVPFASSSHTSHSIHAADFIAPELSDPSKLIYLPYPNEGLLMQYFRLEGLYSTVGAVNRSIVVGSFKSEHYSVYDGCQDRRGDSCRMTVSLCDVFALPAPVACTRRPNAWITRHYPCRLLGSKVSKRTLNFPSLLFTSPCYQALCR
jgi:hypothetical protein